MIHECLVGRFTGWRVEDFDFIEPPKELLDAAEDMRRRSGIPNPPPVYFVRSARGHGGYFIPDSNMVIVGIEDAQAIAANIWQENEAYVRAVVADIVRRHGAVPGDPWKFLWIAAAGRIVGHELGHAIVRYRGWRFGFDNEEAAADLIAGQLDALRARDARLGRLIFDAIGCIGPRCDHPSPAGREQAYAHGYGMHAGA